MSKENPNEFKIINKNERLHYRQIINQLKQQLEEKDKEINQLKQEKKNAGEEKARAYLDTLTKPKIIELCLQYINDKNIAEQQLEALKQEVEQHDLPDYCTRTGTDCTNLGKIEELQRQLAEKDIRIADLEDKDWFEANIKQLEEQNDRLIGKLKERDKEIEELKQNNKIFMQLVEETKSKNIDDFAFLVRVINGSYIQKLRKANRKVQELERLQNQLAIQELEKAKDTIKHFCNIHNDEYYGVKSQVKGIEQDVCDQINQQIKELKGENK